MSTGKQSSILVIDNNQESIALLHDLLADKPYNIVASDSGENGFSLLLKDPELYSAIILGTNIEDIDSLQLLHKINACSVMKTIPVIVDAATGTLQEMEAFIKAGARYYLPKTMDREVIPEIIDTAIRDQERYNKIEQSVLGSKPISTLMKASFSIQTLSEAQVVANLIANECPNPRLAAVGITEMLINAIEHGNLGIGYLEKTKLHENEQWLNEIERRLLLPENLNKFVTVNFSKTDKHIKIRIVDQGNGFDWRQYQDLDSRRVFDNHGRGIIMARSLVFENLIYHGNGNDVECIIPLT